jgi:uncharacterized delta-60 repeat protein
VLPSGQLLLVGSACEDGDELACEIVVARLTANGALDPAFGVAGAFVTPMYAREADLVRPALAVAPDGSLFVLSVTVEGEMSSAVVAKLSADGVLDASFGTGGFFRGGFGSAVTFASDLDVDAQGRPLVAGTREGGPTAAAVLRVTTAGALDATFGTNGIVTTNFGADQARIRGVDLEVDAAGRILLAAEIFTPSAAMNGGSWGLARFDAAGNADAAGFCTQGRSGFAGSASVRMGLTSAGKPVVATTNQLVSGGTAPGPVVFRFQGGDGAAACDTPIDGAKRGRGGDCRRGRVGGRECCRG